MLALLLTLATATAPVIVPLEGADGTPGVSARFAVDAPAPLVLELLWDVDRFLTIFPDIKSMAVLQRPGPNDLDVRFVVDAVVASPTYTLRRHLDRKAGTITWRNIAGDLKKLEGRWIVVPTGQPGKTGTTCDVVYESYVDIGVPGITGMYRDIVLQKLDQMVERVRAGAARAVATQPPSVKAEPAPASHPTTTTTTTTTATTTTTTAPSSPVSGP